MHPLISAPVVGFIQYQNSRVHTMIPWFPDAKWTPVPGGLEDHPDFLMYISIMPVKSLTENTKEPWFKAYFKLPK